MHLRGPHVFLISLLFLGALPVGCKRGPNLNAEVARLQAEAEGLRQKLGAAEKSLETKQDELALAADAAGTAKRQWAEQEQIALQKDAQIQAVQTELGDLRKSEASVFAEISGLQQQGLTTAALARYEQFLKDYPRSPLTAHATAAIAALSVTAEREARTRVSLIAPQRAARELLKQIGEGAATLEEIAPLLKKKTPAEVVKLLGKPNKTYRNGAEFGYVDRVVDATGSGKETLIISFDSDSVTGLRAGYLGREIKP